MIKRYEPKYVVAWDYTDEEGKTERIVFKANGYIFPLFKSYTGEELEQALNSYSSYLLKIATPEFVGLMSTFTSSASVEEKTKTLLDNQSAVVDALKTSIEASNMNGLSLIEALLIVSHVCALPKDEQAEALSYGLEVLPPEAYADTALFYRVLEMCMSYSNNLKKNSQVLKHRQQTTH